MRDDKRGYIVGSLPFIVERLGIDPNEWIDHVKGFGKAYAGCAGSQERLMVYAHLFDRRWCKGMACSGERYLRV